MVLEEFIRSKRVMRRPLLSLILGFIYTIIGFLVARIFFYDEISIAMLFLTTLLLAFLGILIAYIVLGFAVFGSNNALMDKTFEFQTQYLVAEQGLDKGLVESFITDTPEPTATQFLTLTGQNLIVVIICFVLSFLYGASAIFLIILNASIFARFILIVTNYLAESIRQGLMVFGIVMIHLLPEMTGFLVAAIAGGVISKAVIIDRKHKIEFRNVIKDGTILLLISIVLIVIGALLETFVSTRLFSSLF